MAPSRVPFTGTPPRGAPPDAPETLEQAVRDDCSAVVARLLESMRRTQQGITLCAVVAFALSTTALVGAIATFVSSARPHVGPVWKLGPWSAPFAIVSSAIFLVGGNLLWSTRSSIEAFLATDGSARRLAAVVHQQARHWRLCGIVAGTSLALYVGVVLLFTACNRAF